MCCSKCGMDCNKCSRKEEFGCLGCNNMQSGYWGEKCEIKECCEGKKLEHCGFCPDFPCEMLREISFDDESRELSEKKLKNILLGMSLGVVFGAVLGAWQGMPAAFVVGGVVIGVGIALLLNFYKKY